MATAKYRGLFRMRIQTYLTAFVVNAKRMVKLVEQKQSLAYLNKSTKLMTETKFLLRTIRHCACRNLPR